MVAHHGGLNRFFSRMRRFIGVLYGNAEPGTVGHCILAPHPQHAIAKAIYGALLPVVDAQGRLVEPAPIHALTFSAAPQGGLKDVLHDSPGVAPLGDPHDGPFGSGRFIHSYPPNFEQETTAAMADRLELGLQSGEVHLLVLANNLPDDADPDLSDSIYDLFHQVGNHYQQQRPGALDGLHELFAEFPHGSPLSLRWQGCSAIEACLLKHIMGLRNFAEFLRACGGLRAFVSGWNAVETYSDCDCQRQLYTGALTYDWRQDQTLIDPLFGPVVDVEWPQYRDLYRYGLGSFVQLWAHDRPPA